MWEILFSRGELLMSSEYDLEQWMEEQKHLPECLRDFHDAKDVFKNIHTVYGDNEENTLKKVNWIQAHIYTMDYFLWYMAQRGYKLQRIRKKFPFKDISEDTERRRKREIEAFKAHIESEARKNEGTTKGN